MTDKTRAGANRSPSFQSASPQTCDGGSKVQDQSGQSSNKWTDLCQTALPATLTAADLEYIDTMVSGDFYESVRSRLHGTDRIIVAKAYNRKVWRSEYLFHAELRFLQVVQGPWIVVYLGCLYDIEENFLLFEYLENGNMHELLQQSPLSEPQVKIYIAEMFMAVDYIHQRGFMHRDLKPSNFLIRNDGHLKLAEFGLSYCFKSVPSGGEAQTLSIKPPLVTSPVFGSGVTNMDNPKVLTFAGECNISYTAPEVLRLVLPRYQKRFRKKMGYSYLCDYWSLGVILYRMLYNCLPFNPDSSRSILEKVLDFRKSLTFPMNPPASPSAMLLMRALLCKEKRRLGSTGLAPLQNHPFFEGLVWSKLGQRKINIPVTEEQVDKFHEARCLESRSGSIGQARVKESVALPHKDTGISSGEDSDDEDDDQLNNLPQIGFNIPLCEDPSVGAICPGSTSGGDKSTGASPSSKLSKRYTPTDHASRTCLAQSQEASLAKRFFDWFTSSSMPEEGETSSSSVKR